MNNICKICKKEFNAPPSKADRTCSRECGYKMLAEKKYKKEFDISCKQCHQFKHVPSIKQKKSLYFKKGFCSRHCQKLSEQPIISCLICQTKFQIRYGRKNTAKYCSKKCYWNSRKGKIVNQLFGKRNPKWNPDKQSRTYPSQYLKEKVKKADNYKCYICGGKENLHVHHMIPFKLASKHLFENLVTVCFNCHWKIHRKEYRLTLSGVERRPAVWMFQ